VGEGNGFAVDYLLSQSQTAVAAKGGVDGDGEKKKGFEEFGDDNEGMSVDESEASGENEGEWMGIDD